MSISVTIVSDEQSIYWPVLMHTKAITKIFGPSYFDPALVVVTEG